MISFVLGFAAGAIAALLWAAYRTVSLGRSGHLKDILQKHGLL